METHAKPAEHASHSHHYRKLAIMSVLSFIAMYILIYSMVDSFPNVLNNVNQIYMAGLMTGAMILMEIAVMANMYKNKKLNFFIVVIGAILLVLSFLFIRMQTGVGDRQFLKSMIPHHAAAILMVKETQLNDPELQKLASDIISAQQKEIDFMKAKLKSIDEN
jgi:uncharacterized protein (DUF305 family)